MICLFHFPSLQPSVDTTFFASMQSFIHTTFEVASMHLHRRKVASMRLFQNCTGHSTYRVMKGEPFSWVGRTGPPSVMDVWKESLPTVIATYHVSMHRGSSG